MVFIMFMLFIMMMKMMTTTMTYYDNYCCHSDHFSASLVVIRDVASVFSPCQIEGDLSNSSNDGKPHGKSPIYSFNMLKNDSLDGWNRQLESHRGLDLLCVP